MEPQNRQIIRDAATLGARLRRLRQLRGVTVERLASQVDLSKGYISLVESGKRDPHWGTLMRILHALDETLCAFLTRGGEFSPSTGEIRFGREHLLLVAGAEPDEWGEVPDADVEGYTWILTPYRPDMRSEVIRFRLPPHATWTSGTMTLPAHAVAFGVEGRTLLELEDTRRDEFILEKGEILQFNCETPHRFRNYTDEPAEVLLTIAPAVF